MYHNDLQHNVPSANDANAMLVHFSSFLCNFRAINHYFCVFLSDRSTGMSRLLPAIRRRKSKFFSCFHSILSVFDGLPLCVFAVAISDPK